MFWFITFLLFMVVAVMVGIGLSMRFLINRTLNGIEKKHMAAEYIIDTGLVPEQWVEELPDNGEKQKEKALKRIDKLIKHFKNSRLVEDDETRETLIKQLKKNKKRWQERKWEEIIPDIYLNK